MISEVSVIAPSPLSLVPCRRHGMDDVIARAHAQHMLSPGSLGNQTTAVSSPYISQDVFSERPHAYQENKGKSKRVVHKLHLPSGL